MTASTTMYCFGTAPGVLLTARAFQGASAAIVGVIGLALIVDTMGPTHAGTAMGWQAVGTFAGAILGPSLGGFVFDQAGHFAVFGMAFALLILDIFLRLVMIERKIAQQWIADTIQPSCGPLDETSGLLNNNEQLRGSQGAIHGSNMTDPSVPAIWTSDAAHLKETVRPNVSTNLLLLSKPRLLTALWALFVCSILLSSLETVCLSRTPSPGLLHPFHPNISPSSFPSTHPASSPGLPPKAASYLLHSRYPSSQTPISATSLIDTDHESYLSQVSHSVLPPTRLFALSPTMA